MPKITYLPKYETDQIMELIRQHIHNERNRKILQRRLIDGITFEKLAEEFELSVRRTKTIVYEGQDIVFSHIPG